MVLSHIFRPTRIILIAIAIAVLGVASVVWLRLKGVQTASPPPVAAAKPTPTSGPREPTIDVMQVVQHGHIIEIRAKTEAGASVMVNGEKAAVIFDNATIRHFVGPLPDGISEITISAQNEQGGVATKRVSVVLP